MKDFELDAPGAVDKANKAINAALTFVGTYVGVLVADLSDAAGWVSQAVVVAGGAVGTAVVYWTKNRPKYRPLQVGNGPGP